MTVATNNKKHLIVVRDGAGTIINRIYRKIWAEQIGNFNPIFCRYKKQRCLVKSESGDLSDPFRREESDLKSLYIVYTEDEPLFCTTCDEYKRCLSPGDEHCTLLKQKGLR